MQIQKKSLLKFFSSTSYILIAALTIVLSISAIFLFKKTNLQLIHQKRDVVSELLIESVKAPVLQGSYFEAIQRLKVAVKNKQISCFVARKPFQYNSCENTQTVDMAAVPKTVEYGDSDGKILVEMVFYFSVESNILNPWSFSLIGFVLLVISSGTVFVILSAQKKKIFLDFNALYRITDAPSNQAHQKFEFSEFQIVGNKLKELVEVNSKNEREVAIIAMATQVAHDIRSPLEVLKSLKNDVSILPEESARRIQMGINRIEEITFNLLKTHKEVSGLAKSEELLNLITCVITEKNIEYRDNPEVEIVGLFDSNSYGLFSRIHRVTMKSILSNLINNSFEAFHGRKGIISISLISDNELNILQICDNGIGVSSETKSKLFTKNFTTKGNGNGIGLFNAKHDLEAVGGSIEFDSTMGKGTTFIITLPKSDCPSTFIESIKAYKYERIIVLDDDPAFHEVWDKRLIGVESKVEHIHSVEEMFSRYKTLDPHVLLLSDFELMDKQYDGIDTILKLNHSAHSILVTARNEELAIQDRCLRAGIKLLPKSLVNYVKIDIQEPQNLAFVIVLIDDDKLVQLNWSAHCKKNGLQFLGFKSIADFIDSATIIDKSSRIFIDSNLGNGIRGEIDSEKIYDLGYLNLFLATGYEKDSIVKPHWIKEIFSKSPDQALNSDTDLVMIPTIF